LNTFLDKNGFHIDEYKETLYKVSFESFLPGPDFKEDEFKVDVFSNEGDPDDIIERIDGAVILVHMEMYAPDLNMKHVLSTRTDLKEKGKPLSPLMITLGPEGNEEKNATEGLIRAMIGKTPGTHLSAHVPPSLCHAGKAKFEEKRW